MAALSEFTRMMFEARGMPTQRDVDAFLAAGFEEQHVLQIAQALAVKALSNYSDHINHPDLDEAFVGHVWQE